YRAVCGGVAALRHPAGVLLGSFFFSSRRLHTIAKRDWSSDVCSSDLFQNRMLICLSLSTADKLAYGSEIEGHPDNIAPALLGGLVITVQTPDEEIDYIQLPTLDLDLVAYIPDFELKTAAAREVLPETYSRERAAFGSGVSNLMVASLITGNYELAGKMMEKDIFHEP